MRFPTSYVDNIYVYKQRGDLLIEVHSPYAGSLSLSYRLARLKFSLLHPLSNAARTARRMS